jgi:hypothetical protein
MMGACCSLCLNRFFRGGLRWAVCAWGREPLAGDRKTPLFCYQKISFCTMAEEPRTWTKTQVALALVQSEPTESREWSAEASDSGRFDGATDCMLRCRQTGVSRSPCGVRARDECTKRKFGRDPKLEVRNSKSRSTSRSRNTSTSTSMSTIKSGSTRGAAGWSGRPSPLPIAVRQRCRRLLPKHCSILNIGTLHYELHPREPVVLRAGSGSLREYSCRLPTTRDTRR